MQNIKRFSKVYSRSYSDPGHGWLKVPRSNLASLNILHKISSYSYQRGDYVYLEEDSDCNKYFEAIEQQLGNDFVEKYKRNIKHFSSNKSSKIRSYASYQMTMQELNS